MLVQFCYGNVVATFFLTNNQLSSYYYSPKQETHLYEQIDSNFVKVHFNELFVTFSTTIFHFFFVLI